MHIAIATWNRSEVCAHIFETADPMLYEFKSRATGSVMMTQAVAERILQIIGKSPQPKGVILPEHMGQAIAALQAAVHAERAAPPPAKKTTDRIEDEEQSEPAVTLGQRAFPFIEMLRLSLAAGKEITWGV
jgi:hypothetical protein